MIWSFDVVLSVYEAVDPDFDTMTAGGSWGMLKPDMETLLAASWKNVPLIGSVIAKLGLPGVLTSLLVVAASCQISYLFRRRRNLKIYISEVNSMHQFLNLTHHIADVGGLMFMDRAITKALIAQQYP